MVCSVGLSYYQLIKSKFKESTLNNRDMKDTEKPDFQKMAEDNKDLYSHCEYSAYVDGCEKIWKDYVLRFDKSVTALSAIIKESGDRIAELEKVNAQLRHQVIQDLKEYDTLKSELDKAKKIISDYACYGDSRIMRDQAVKFTKGF